MSMELWFPHSAISFRDFVPRLKLLTRFREFRKSLKMRKNESFQFILQIIYMVLFLIRIMALRFYAAPSQI